MNFNQFLKLDSFGRDEHGVEMTHLEKCRAIIRALGYEEVKSCIPFSLEEIQVAIKTDKYLNNLEMRKWHTASGFVTSGADCTLIGSRLTSLYSRIGVKVFSLAEGVSLLKECARMWTEEVKQ